MPLSIMWGPTCTQRTPMTKIRKPLRKIPSGITNATSTILRQGVLRNRWDASRLVMNNTQLEWMPLHSWATRSTIPGNSKKVPWRRIGVPDALKNKAAASADATAKACSNHFVAGTGSGTVKIKNVTGKAMVAIHFEPKNRKPPTATKLTNARAIRLSPLLKLRSFSQPIQAARGAIAIADIVIVPAIEVRQAAKDRERFT